MEESSGTKLTGIRQIVRLKELLQKWQSVTLGSKPGSAKDGQKHGGVSPAVNKRVKKVRCCDLDRGKSTHGPPPDVPKGYLAVYVGSELRRFIIPTSYLRHSLFKVLLKKAEEEFGFDHNGGLTIPCEVETFKYLVKCMENHQKDHPNDRSAGDSSAVEE